MKKITLLLAFFLTTMLSFGADMTGTYTVGTGGTYATLSAAVTDLNAANITGNVVLEIVSDITEPANIGLGVNTNGYSITIRPNTDADRTITFSSTTDNTGPSGHFVIGNPSPTVTWTDALTIATNNVTIDGFASGFTTKRLKLTNSSASTANARLITVVGACQNTLIKNCILENKSTSATSPVCIVAVARQTTGIDVAPINLTIDNNTLTAVGGIVSMGMRLTNSGTPTSRISGFVFKNNIVTARRRLLEINYTNGAEIFKNEFTTAPNGAAGTVTYGLWTSTGVIGTIKIYENKFLKATSEETTANGHRVVSLASTATYEIYNNTFSGLDKTKASTVATNLVYLFYSGVAGKIYHNTFYMPALTDASSTGYHAAIQLSGNTAEIKNNIFISDEPTHANTYFISAIPTPASDYNLFYLRQPHTGGKVVSTYVTLADYQAANPSKDRLSKSVNVNFADESNGNLHLAGASLNDVNLAAPLIATVTTDIDGNLRTALTYKGANQASDMTAVAKQFTVTVPKGTEKVYVAGDFTGKFWDIANPFQLIKTANLNEFTEILPCVNGVEYKYLCEKGDWDYQEGVFDNANPPLQGSNRTYNAADVVPLWYRVNKITLNATPTPQVTNLWVKGSWNGWATGIEMTQVTPPSPVKGIDEMEKVKSETNAVSYSVTLGGNPGDKFPANTEYKYYTNVVAPDNWEVGVDGLPISNRWAIAPVMNDVIPKFSITTDNATPTITARILRTYEGVQIELESTSTVEIYTTSGLLIDKVRTSGTYTKELNSGVYIIRIDGQATKFMK